MCFAWVALGLLILAINVTPITKVDKGSTVTPSSAAVKVYHDVNPDTGTNFYFAVHNPSSATTDDSFTFPISTADGTYTVPLRLAGQDAKTLVADYDLEGEHLVYSTSEIETHRPGVVGGFRCAHPPYTDRRTFPDRSESEEAEESLPPGDGRCLALGPRRFGPILERN